MVYLLVAISVVAMTAAQLLLKKGVLLVGGFPQNASQLGHFLLTASGNVYIISAAIHLWLYLMFWLPCFLCLSSRKM